jgi:cell division protein FtsL
MAACVTTYFETGRGLGAQIAEHNAAMIAQQIQLRRRVRVPEYYFAKHFDNSRLVKASDPVRVREMRVFSAAVAVLFSLIMIYGLQHFYAIESSYHVESEKQTLDQLREENRQLHLSEAELTQPGRIDQMARQLGLAEPQPGQVIFSDARPTSGAPTLAQVAPTAPAAQ